VDSVTVDSGICADFGFDLTLVENGTFKTRTFYDREGNTVKSVLSNFNVRYTSTATANEKTLSANYPLVFITYANADDSGWTPQRLPRSRGRSSTPRRGAPHPRPGNRRSDSRGGSARACRGLGRGLLQLLRVIDKNLRFVKRGFQRLSLTYTLARRDDGVLVSKKSTASG
jgi:hypothetical protein